MDVDTIDINGTVTGGVSYKDSLYRNTGSAFADVTPASIKQLEADHGVQWADVDGDGDVDSRDNGQFNRRFGRSRAGQTDHPRRSC